MMTDSTPIRVRALAQAAAAPVSLKKMLAYQIEREMARQNINRVQMAAQMNTSRAVLNRLLDPDNQSVTLATLQKVAEILGCEWQIFLREK